MLHLISVDHDNGFVYIGRTQDDKFMNKPLFLMPYVVSSSTQIIDTMKKEKKSYSEVCKEIYNTVKNIEDGISVDQEKKIIHNLETIEYP